MISIYYPVLFLGCLVILLSCCCCLEIYLLKHKSKQPITFKESIKFYSEKKNFIKILKSKNFLIELLLFIILFAKGYTQNITFLAFFNYYIAFLFLYAFATIDFKFQIVPNVLILFMGLTGIILLIPSCSFISALLIVALSIGIFILGFLTYLVSKNSIGLGDIKLISVLSLFTGGFGIYSIIFNALVLAVIYAIYLMVIKKENKKMSIPFIPFIMLGYIIYLLTLF